MNKNNDIVEEYLAKVRSHLKSFSDCEVIISELRAHIWDTAQEISFSEGVDISKAFEITLERMETPEKLAEKFIEEDANINDNLPRWASSSIIPEAPIEENKLLLLGMLGIGYVIMISVIFTFVTNNNWLFFLSFVPGVTIVALFIIFLYFSDQKTFDQQIEQFRSKFFRTIESVTTTVPKEPSFWDAFGVHLGGLFGAVFGLLTIAILFIIQVTEIVPLFNELWFQGMNIVVFVLLIVDLGTNIFKIMFGEIRQTRMVSAFDNFVNSFAMVLVVLAYPFTFGQLILFFIGSSPDLDAEAIGFFTNIDTYIRIGIGFIGIIKFISGIYDVFKFGAWKPSDRKSLV